MTKLDIYNATLKIIAAEGFESLSMRKIAREIGCTVSSLYNHFIDKDDLLNGLFWHCYEKLEFDYDLVIIEEHLYDTLMIAINNKEEFMFFIKNYKSTFLSDETKKKLEDERPRRRAYFEKLLLNNNLKKDNVHEIHFIIIGVSMELIQRDEISPERIQSIVKLICTGIKEN